MVGLTHKRHCSFLIDLPYLHALLSVHEVLVGQLLPVNQNSNFNQDLSPFRCKKVLWQI